MSEVGLPIGWRRASLATLASYVNGFAFNDQFWSEKGLPIVRIAQITGSQPVVDRFDGQLQSHYRLDDGDLIFSWSGTLAVVRWHGGPAWLNQHLFRVEPRSDVDRNLLFHLLQRSVAEMDKRSHGSTMKHIKRGELAEYEVVLPKDLNEQAALAKVLDTLDTTIRQTEAIIAKLKQVKQGLLHDLLTRGIEANGELRPPQSEAPHLYKASPLGWIPTEWETREGRNVCSEIVVGIVVKPTQYYRDHGIPIFRSANVREQGLSLQDLVYMDPKHHRAQQKSCVKPGDVLTVRTGYPGTSCVVDAQVEEANCVDIIISRPGPSISSQYWAQWINSPKGKEQVLRVQGGLAQQHFNVGDLAAMQVSVPPYEEQQRIIGRLDAMNARIKQECASRNGMTDLKSGLMDDLLTGRVRVTLLLTQPATT